MKKLLVFVFIIAAMVITSCSSTTLIQSSPNGATVYINGEVGGTTPYTLSDSKISGARTPITLKKEGFEDFYTILVKNESVNVGAVVGGVLFFWPALLWTMDYKPVHTYPLTPFLLNK